MITKDNVFASGGQQAPSKTMADFRQGMVPNTVAMAEDVNTYGNWSDKDLKVVCDEIVNALRAYGVNPNNSYTPSEANQLATMITTKLKSGFLLTGIDYNTFTEAPVQSADGATISFTTFDVVFNTGIYFGNTESQMVRATIATQDFVAPADGYTGVYFVYANTQGGLGLSQTPILGSNGAEQCMLGSVFCINGIFQAGSWKFQPWLQATSLERRESPTAGRKGGFISPGATPSTLQMGAVQILDEGIGTLPNEPSIMKVNAMPTFSYKFLYPKYNPSDAAKTVLDTTHIYDRTTSNFVDISWKAGFICMVPCITPSGQTLMIPAMGHSSNDYSDAIFNSMQDAINAIFGLQYDLTAIDAGGQEQNGSVAGRAIYLGQTIVVKIGTTDLNNKDLFTVVGVVPQALAGFSDASGQSGGGAGEYVPLPIDNVGTGVNFAFAPRPHACSVVTGSPSSKITVNLPQASSNVFLKDLEIQYKHNTGNQGLNFVSGYKWWGGAGPSWIEGNVYTFIAEQNDGQWYIGYLTRGA